MLPNHKFKAFTLIELVVAMVLSSIVIGTALSAFLISNKQFNTFSATLDKNYQIQQLYSLLEYDFSRAQYITITPVSILISLPNSEKNTINYQLDNNTIKREYLGQIEKFNMTSVKKEAFFQNNPVFATSDIIDQLHLSLIFQEDSYEFKYHKEYAAYDLLKWQNGNL